MDITYLELMTNKTNKAFLRKKMILYALEHGNKPAARKYQVTVKTVRKWRKRYEEHQEKGLVDQSKRPHTIHLCPNRKELAIALRVKRKYKNIGSVNLKQEYDLSISPKAILNIWRKRGLVKRKRRKYKTKKSLRHIKKQWRFAEQICVDTKHLYDIPEYYPYIEKFNLPKYQYTAREVTSGFQFLAYADELSIAYATEFIRIILEHLKNHGVNLKGIRIQTDNGSEFIGSWNKKGISAFTEVVESYEAQHVTIPPKRHTFQSDVETVHRIIEDEFFEIEKFSGRKNFIQKMATYLLYFNALRKNTYKENQTPWEIAKAKIKKIKPSILNLPAFYIDELYQHLPSTKSIGGYHLFTHPCNNYKILKCKEKYMQSKQQKKYSLKTLTLTLLILLLSNPISAKHHENEISKDLQNALSIQKVFRSIYKKVNPATVRIETEDTIKVRQNPFFNDPFFRRFFNAPNRQAKRKVQGLGSGFIISANGYVVTNHHVIGKQGSKGYVDKIKVKLVTGKTYNAKVIGSDQASDIAVLKITPTGKLPYAELGDSDSVEVGDFAIAIGNPFGLSSTFTTGIISSKSQEIETTDGIPRIQTDAPINRGNSGGPLMNIRGEVIGINQLIVSPSGGSVGLGFAIPINYANSVIEKIKSGKKIKHGYIGVSINSSPTSSELKELSLEGKEGLLVNQVVLGSPAWKAGLRPYDFITHLDGKRVKKFSTLKSAILRKGVDNSIIVRALRNGKSQRFKVVVGEAKN